MTTGEEVDSVAGGEELEPLFEYKRVQPKMKVCFDDSDLEAADIFKHCNKRPKVHATTEEEEESKLDEEPAAAKVVVLDEEDWLQPPPPKAAFRAPAEEDSALRELRLKKQEWARFAESAQDILQNMDEIISKEIGPKEPPEQIILDEESEPPVKKAREKIVISIQDKDGQQQTRVYKDEKFEKLLRVYAKKAKLNPLDVYFVFDGEKVNPSSTPQDLDLEDEDMIEEQPSRQPHHGTMHQATQAHIPATIVKAESMHMLLCCMLGLLASGSDRGVTSRTAPAPR